MPIGSQVKLPTENDVKDKIEKPLQYRDDVISDYSEQLKAIDNHSKEQAKIIEHFKNMADALSSENKKLERRLDMRPVRKLKKYAHEVEEKIKTKRRRGQC